ncbi:sterol desaturase family protein [Psychrobium sp. 1_MG-2023]|uniref:sterol desaturase family protein n=1 Tax=Psychrobium sp. 1_MG-2023 TaxID=3062624 RepID=UPI000C342CD7|nr:sterol desaturase family protein [Psychrobium sp. 1_MG-2023]MDP2561647.1 sterol desaturase family protein [Psychrobium sp. 1_MG-2023]PKF55664.1 sterol desaturase [Alteromonadales bacterium alter-6D02]
MFNWILDHESSIRLSIFALVFLMIALWELLSPKRSLSMARSKRWLTNLSLVIVDGLTVKVIFPIAAMGVAILCQQQQWGLFQQIELPIWSAAILSWLILDMVIYFQHKLFHSVPILWRLHQVHHSDIDIDVSTGVRFHPFEIIISMLIKLITIFALGAPLIAVFIFEVCLNAFALFNHANLRLPHHIDRTLRRLIVTPDMHRVHHSVIPREYNSNFGATISLWDRLFGSYIAQPIKGHAEMNIGLSAYRSPQYSKLHTLLIFPFKSK